MTTTDPSCVVESCTGTHKARGLCRYHYQQRRRAGTLSRHTVTRAQRPSGLELGDALRSIGWESYPESGCWLWRGSRTSSGYGQIGYRDRVLKAHRVAYMIFVGELPDGTPLHHLCGVRHCVNPEHLTAERPPRQVRERPSRAQSTGRGRSTLTEEDVTAIRLRWDTGNWRQSELARRFGVSDSVISGIVHGRTWRHVEWRRYPEPGTP